MSLFVTEIKSATAMGSTEPNRVAETILVPILAEVYGYQDLKDLNSEERRNYPGIDLGDEKARVAFQITSTTDSEKIKKTLEMFVKNKYYEKYDRLIIYTLIEKQDYYSGRGYEEIIQGKFNFNKDKDILDYRDILRVVATFQIDKAQKVESILEKNFGSQKYAGYEIAERVKKIVQEYTKLFVGRETEIQQLESFLNENKSGVVLVTGGAGFGKSALLANWKEMRHDEGYFVGYHCFNTRSNVTRSIVQAYRNLLCQLYIYYELSDRQLPNEEIHLRDVLSGIVHERKSRLEHPLIIILDGLDEAEDIFEPPFLSPLPDGVFIIVSARAKVGEKPKYLQGWQDLVETSQGSYLHLDRLSSSSISSWLQQAGTGELAEYGADEDFIKKLDETTKGFPLYLRFLIDDLLYAVRQGEDVQSVLAKTPQGFDSYVEQQLERLDELDLPKQRWQFFALLSVAKGVLNKEDVKEITGMSDRDLRQLQQSWQVTRWMQFSEGKSYAFSHPLLATTFAEQLRDEAELALEKLLDWCQSYEKQDWPEATPEYILSYYAEHLREAGRKDALYALINKRWMEIQLRRTHSHRAFAKDVAMTLEVANSEDPPNLVQVARCCLINATLVWLTANIQPEILTVLTQLDQLKKALDLAALMQYGDKQSRAYRLIAEALISQNNIEKAREVIEQVEAAIIAMTKPTGRLRLEGNASREMVQVDSKDGTKDLANQEVFEPRLIGFKEILVNELVELATLWLQVDKQDRSVYIANQALSIAQIIENQWAKANALSEIARVLILAGQKSEAIDVAHQAFSTAETIGCGWAVYELQGVIQVWIKTEQFNRVVDISNRALTIAEIIEELQYKVNIMKGVAQILASIPEKDRALNPLDILTEAFNLAEKISNEWTKICVLNQVAKILCQQGEEDSAKNVVSRGLEVFETIGDNQNKAYLLSEMARILAELGDGRAIDIANRALLIAETSGTGWVVTEVVRGVTQLCLSENHKDRENETENILNRALELAEKIEYIPAKAAALSAVAQALVKGGTKDRAADIANQVLGISPLTDDDKRTKEGALRGIAQALVQVRERNRAIDVANCALTVAETIKNMRDKAYALSQLAQVLIEVGEKEKAVEVAIEALTAALAVEDEGNKGNVLAWVAPSLVSVGNFDQALAVVEAMEHKNYRVGVLRAIIQVLAKAENKDKAANAANQALLIAQTVDNSQTKVDLFAKLALALFHIGQKETKDKALDVVDRALAITKTLENQETKALALNEIAQVLNEMGEQPNRISALEIVEQALVVAERLSKEENKVWVFRAVALTLIKIGELDKAIDIINRALDIAKEIEDENQADALLQVAYLFSLLGNKDKAVDVANQALAAVDHYNKAIALRRVIEVLAHAGDVERALEIGQTIGDDLNKAYGFSKVAQIFANAGLDKPTLQALGFAFTSARLVDGRNMVFQVLERGATALAAIAQSETLWALYQTVLDVESWWTI